MSKVISKARFIVNFSIYYSGDKIKDEMGAACSTHTDEKCI